MFRKNLQWTVKGFVLCLSILSFWNITAVLAKGDSEQVSINLYANNNGIPIKNVVYSAVNLDVAYGKIIEGDFSNEVTSGVTWKDFQNQVHPDLSQANLEKIELANGLVLAPGIKHSQEEARAIMEQILRMGGSGLPLLEELNGEDTQNIIFHQPERGRVSNTFTNLSGQAVAIVNKGLTAIMTNEGKFQKLVMVDKNNQEINLDVANLDNRLEFTVEDIPSGAKTNFGRYVVESGEKNTLTFRLTIKKNLVPSGSSVLLAPSSNLIITSITPSPEVQGVEITDIGTPSQLESGNPNRNISFPALSEDLSLTIRAYVLPTTVSQGTAGNVSISASAVDDNDVTVGATTPQLLLSGANFAMVDNSKNNFATGAEYVLGKHIDDKFLVYSAEHGWIQEDNMKQLDLSQVTVLKGGMQYSIGETESFSIPDTTTRFNYNSDKNQKINQSLIQIIGLAPGDNYFIYPIKAADNQNKIGKPLDFSVHAYSSIGRNGSLINHNTLGEAKVQNFSLNTTIPDFKAGSVEYNVISVNNVPQKSTNPLIRIILPIALISLLMVSFGFCLIKFT